MNTTQTQVPEIKATKDYKKFKIVMGNRILDNYNIVRLTNSVARHNLLPFNPIIVNEKFEVIDGQHRLEIARVNDLTLYYVVAPGTTLEDIRDLNVAKTKWLMSDYLHSYIAQGSKDYKRFYDFITDHKISVRMGLAFSRRLDGGAQYSQFKKGEYLFTSADLEMAEERVTYWETLKPFFLDRSFYHMEYIRALNTLSERGLTDEFIEKLKIAGKPMVRRGTSLDYMRFFEDTLNYRRQGEKIYLSA